MQYTRDLLRQLANFGPGDALVLSIYLDMRPHGASPAIRPSQVMLTDRFRQIEKTLLPRGAVLDNFRIDANRVQHFLDEHAEPWLQGVAIFACTSRQLFEVIETGVPFENQVALEPVPDLFQLARLVDEQETAVVALVDTNTTRLFVTRSGFLEEVAGPDDSSFGYRQRNTGGLNHKQYQRRVQNQREEFAREAASALEKLVTQEGARRVILAGDAVAIPLLHRALSPQLEPLIHEEILRLDIRTPRHEVSREIAPILAQVEEEESHARADQLVEAVREQGLGVIGQQETRDSLEHGQADVLVLAEEAPLDDQERNDLVRLATLSGAEVDLVTGHEIFQQMGGVGALLRYRPSWV
ncbi:MAG: host attachment protein [Chloroflexi bacterium]|nr:host attachment protein [Chloroflexota bacterium]